MRLPFIHRFSQDKVKLIGLMIASAMMLLLMLGAREIWTQEHRWADIVAGMFYRHDFLHPFLGQSRYYDKPLLSYWLIAGFSWLLGGLSTLALRLPSALAGVIAVFSIYRLGLKLHNQRLGLLAGWMLLTTFYFIFWARTSSADMLNLAGSLFAVSWYFEKRDQALFFDFMIFFIVLALTALCKGLIAIAVTLIAIMPDMVRENRWKRYLSVTVFLSALPAVILYLLPFWASAHFGGDTYGQNGLYLVYRENILRYFQPFDHKDPVYSYLIYLPLYLLPWTFFFIPALCSLPKRWRAMTAESKWAVWVVLLLFMFLTVSGSRRNYYVLPIVPFAILMTADWLLTLQGQWMTWIKRCITGFFIVWVGYFVVLQSWYYAGGGFQSFAKQFNQVMQSTSTTAWQYVLLDPESKVRFYLQLPPETKTYGVIGERQQQSVSSLKAAWPILKSPPKNVIFISRQQYEPFLSAVLQRHYQLVMAKPTFGERLLNMHNANLPIAYVPKE